MKLSITLPEKMLPPPIPSAGIRVGQSEIPQCEEGDFLLYFHCTLSLLLNVIPSLFLLRKAQCTSTGPGTATCQCNVGWTGDGKACVPIDNCMLESRGNCHLNADCVYIGPGQV